MSMWQSTFSVNFATALPVNLAKISVWVDNVANQIFSQFN